MMVRTILIGALALAAGAYAQGPGGPGRFGGPGRGGPGGPRLLGAEAGMPGRLVKNAPYSADIVTESTQTLADGSHIRQSATAHVIRDSEGRTRTEQSLSGLGAIAASRNLPPVVFINDPVAGANYALNPDSKTATKSVGMRPGRGGGPPPDGQSAVRSNAVRPNGQDAPQGRGRMGAFRTPGTNPNVKTESLGTKTMEGVVADGTRTTMTIPAGEMGNEQAIQIVTERWYSNELQTVVYTKHSDPRNGETITRMTNVSRSEPSVTMFQVPADYKVTDAPSHRGPGAGMRPAGNGAIKQ